MINEVFNIDCMEYMQTVPDKYFQLTIADPPYGINAPKMEMMARFNAKKNHKRLNGGAGKLKNRILNQSNCEWDERQPAEDFFNEIFRISENVIIWGGNYFNLPPTRGIVCWDKQQVFKNFSQFELAWTSFDKPAKMFRYKNHGFRTEKKIHPTQKPVELYYYLLENFATAGDKIYDPMMGSQSSRIAAFRMGFDYVGCEINKEYFINGCERFDQHCKDLYYDTQSTVSKQTTLDL